ncbi:MAG TPA: adenosine deaminase [Candidatus Dormibacteraeota bacterium]|nr:adenosine deaminase [Candidatus Dormibacteraeota bacterium]
MTQPFPAHSPTVVDLLPKAELHLHLEGAIRPGTCVELAARHGAEISLEKVAARYQFTDFAGFIETFKWVTSLLRDPEDYAVITRNLLEDLVRQNVVYAEITVSAGVMLLRNQSIEANFAAIHEAAQSVRYSRVRTAWILDCVRQFGADPAMQVARAAVQLQNAGVVAFGMGGDELSVAAANFRSAFDFARAQGLRLVCHAGEIGGPESVREAVEILSAERIGHGIAIMHDPALAESLAAGRIVLENCLTSNLATGALAKQTGNPRATLAEHPLKKLLNAGSLITLSTDDPGMFSTDLLTEYSRAASLGLSPQQLLSLAEQSFAAAFLPPIDKRSYLEIFRAAAKSAALL